MTDRERLVELFKSAAQSSDDYGVRGNWHAR